MEVFVNEKLHQITEGSTISQLLQQIVVESTKGIAIAVGDFVVPRSQWETQKLNSGANILIIKATQGG